MTCVACLDVERLVTHSQRPVREGGSGSRPARALALRGFIRTEVGEEWASDLGAVLGHLQRPLLLPPLHHSRTACGCPHVCPWLCCQRKSVCSVGKLWLSEMFSVETLLCTLPPDLARCRPLSPSSRCWLEREPAAPPCGTWSWALEPSLRVSGCPCFATAMHCLPFWGKAKQPPGPQRHSARHSLRSQPSPAGKPRVRPGAAEAGNGRVQLETCWTCEVHTSI